MTERFNILYHDDGKSPHFDIFFGDDKAEFVPKWHTEPVGHNELRLKLTEYRKDCGGLYLNLTEPKNILDKGVVYPLICGEYYEIENKVYRLKSVMKFDFCEFPQNVGNWRAKEYFMDEKSGFFYKR